MAFHMQALVVAPGGFGTCDEMFEMMTLKQTGKMQAALPIVLLGKEYWQKVRATLAPRVRRPPRHLCRHRLHRCNLSLLHLSAQVIDWDAFAKSGTVAQKDVDELLFTDCIDEAFQFITERIGSINTSPCL